MVDLRLLDSVHTIDLGAYARAPLPDPADEALGRLVQLGHQDPNIREELKAKVDRHLSSLLLTYAERMATLALRSRARELLLMGLVALVLAGDALDVRDGLIVMSLLYRSAEERGVDPTTLFSEVSFMAEGDMREALRTFPKREPHDRSIEAMGYRLENDGERLAYRRLW